MPHRNRTRLKFEASSQCSEHQPDDILSAEESPSDSWGLSSKHKRSRWSTVRHAILPDDVASIFAEMWRSFTAAPLWMKPFSAIAFLFGVAYHLLTLAKIYGIILLLVAFILMVPVGLLFTGFKVLHWLLALVRSSAG